jgi:hypothetical protein
VCARVPHCAALIRGGGGRRPPSRRGSQSPSTGGSRIRARSVRRARSGRHRRAEAPACPSLCADHAQPAAAPRRRYGQPKQQHQHQGDDGDPPSGPAVQHTRARARGMPRATDPSEASGSGSHLSTLSAHIGVVLCQRAPVANNRTSGTRAVHNRQSGYGVMPRYDTVGEFVG